MRVFALLEGTAGERRGYAAALGALAARGHEVTVALAPWSRLELTAAPGLRFLALAPAPRDPRLGAPALPVPAVARDFSDRFPLARSAVELARDADALLLDASSGLGALAAFAARGRRRVALALESQETLAGEREPNLSEVDRARFLLHRIVSEATEDACDATVFPSAAALAARRARAAGEALVIAPPPTVALERGRPALREAPLLVAVGPWIPAAGLDVVVAAFARLRRDVPEARLRCVGASHGVFGARRLFRDVVLDRLAGDARGAIEWVEEDARALALALEEAAALVHAAPGRCGESALVEADAAGVPVIEERSGDAERLAQAMAAGLERAASEPARAPRDPRAEIERCAGEIEEALGAR